MSYKFTVYTGIKMKEKKDETHVTVIDIQALSYSRILRNTV